MPSYRVAHFCQVTTVISVVGSEGLKATLKCRKHGDVPAGFYFAVYNGYVARNPDYACEKCFQEWSKSSGKEYAIVRDPICTFCNAEEDLSVCSECGRTVCPTHRKESMCSDCDEIEGMRSGL